MVAGSADAIPDRVHALRSSLVAGAKSTASRGCRCGIGCITFYERTLGHAASRVKRAHARYWKTVYKMGMVGPGQRLAGAVGDDMTASGDRPGRPRRVRAAAGSPTAESRRATIQDVARQAGVSVSAVSKVLRDAYGVSPQMRAKVTAAIERLEYRPHAGARAMRGSSYTIGVMLVELSSPFQPELVEGITRELEPSPFQEILIAGGISPDRQQRSIEALIDRQVDGLILISPFMSTSWLEQLGASVPTVVLARHGGAVSHDTIVSDNFEGARLMVDHLVGHGHRRILHISQPSGGLTRPFVLSHTDVIETAHTEPGGYEAARQAFARPTPPTAVFAGADIAALGVLRAADERGLRVPDDVTVAGYDNIYAATIPQVSLTTVDQSAQLTGSMSARLLLERMNGRTQPVHYVIAPRLVPRRTSAAPTREPAGPLST
jgi:LacI family transcriptional regulator, galactose operon repressor